jgi:hypothetical protein
MKLLRLLLLPLLVFCANIAAFGQITVGAGTNEAQSIPIEPYYGYTYSESIYLKSELGTSAGTITSIAWYYSGTSNLSNTQAITIWMGHTTKTAYTSTTDWVTSSGLTQVYAGNLGTPSGPGWITITLTVPFAYNNVDNLIIAVDENTASYNSSSDDFYCSASTGTQSIWYRGDATNPDPTAPPTAGGTAAYFPNVKLGGLTAATQPNCNAAMTSPANAATNVNENADLTWSAATGSPTGYYLSVGTTSGGTDIVNNVDVGNVSTYALPTLAYSTTYYVNITPYNANGSATSGCTQYTFTTRVDPTILPPYCNDFTTYPTSATTSPWSEAQGVLAAPTTFSSTTSSSWDVDGFANVGTTGAARINIYSTTMDEWLITPPINLGTGLYQVQFDLALTDFANSGAITTDPSGTTGTDDVFAVVISTDNGLTWSSANVLRKWDNAGSPYIYNNISSTGETVTISLAAYTGTVKIGFYGFSNTSNADNDLHIDNFCISALPACPAPSAMSVANITGTSADLEWIVGYQESTWNIELANSNFTPGTGAATVAFSSTSPAYQVTGLSPVTQYYLYYQADCGGDSSTWVGPVTFTTVFSINVQAQSWQPLGPDDFNQPSYNSVDYTDVATDGNGHVYVVYRDNGNNNKATVMKYDGNSWVTLGSAGFSAGEAQYTRIAIDGNNVPYVVYQDRGNSSRATVKKYDGSSWVTVGSTGFSAGPVWYTSIAIDGNNVPYVVYSSGNSGKATVKKYNGNSWVTVGSAGFSAGSAYYINIAIDGNNVPYVVYRDGGNSTKATVKKYDGSSWVTVGSAGFSAGIADNTSIAIDGNNVPYVVYSDGGNNSKATVMKYNGSSWVTVGSAGFSAGEAQYTSIAIDGNNVPYVMYGDGGNGNKTSVKKYNGSSWVTVGSASFLAGRSDYTNIAIDGNGHLYVVYRELRNANKATVKKYDGSSWVTVGSASLSSKSAACTSIAIDGNNVPYVVYRDNTIAKATVKKYVGNNWVTVGSAGFSAGQAAYTSIAIDGNNVPYVVYSSGNSGKVTVKKYDSSSWVTVGSADFSAGGAYYTSIAINGNNIPYVVYQDIGNGSKATVKKYNGNSWVTVGSAGFSAAGADYTSIAIDGNDVPYVVYSDYGNGSKATVMKYDGSSWVTVGSAGISAGLAEYTSIAIDGNNVPYVVYRDYGNSQKATVMKYVGNSWVTVGSAGFSAGYAGYTSIAIDGNNVPYVVYSDIKATIMKYDGNSWVTVGSADASAGYALYTSIAIDATGKIVVAYSSGDAWAKYYSQPTILDSCLVTWTGLQQTVVRQNGHRLVKSTNTPTGWTGAAISQDSLGNTEDGWVEMEALATNKRLIYGLAPYNSVADKSSIHFGVELLTNATAYVSENGTRKHTIGTYAISDVFRIEKAGFVVKYYHNSMLVYTSTQTPTGVYYADAAIQSLNGTVYNAYASFGCNSPRPTITNDNNTIINLSEVTAYPNPFEDNITVNYAASVEAVKSIEMYNINGQHIRSINVSADGQTIIDTANLQSGLYIITINGTKHLKVVKM